MAQQTTENKLIDGGSASVRLCYCQVFQHYYQFQSNFKGHRKHFQKNLKLTLFKRQTTYKNQNVVYFKKYMVKEPLIALEKINIMKWSEKLTYCFLVVDD